MPKTQIGRRVGRRRCEATANDVERSHTLGFVVENRTGLAGRSAEGEQHRQTVRMSSTDGEGEQHRGTTISSGQRTATVGDLDGEGSDGEGRRSRLGD
ncbi:hypothetical protein LWI29_020884 [Acer saccharum]|uniref:Uncharacterized protein n=1 Tax=Acer saccharum TaxID=4024 RepID=A0AA39RL61_ACESA|nr:hypothetical protein LWI29_010851 [Acer saccharum]KAK0574442.1 hypothetical protein LWI29_023814 [Acer saccharum]KAK0607809.1 hypothetical protein LWI29_020884 [Acer saccharum]